MRYKMQSLDSYSGTVGRNEATIYTCTNVPDPPWQQGHMPRSQPFEPMQLTLLTWK